MFSISSIKPAITPAAGAVKLGLIKHGPDILVGTGVVAIGTGTVMACRATTHSGEIFAQFNAGMEEIDLCIAECGKRGVPEKYTPRMQREDKVKHYVTAFARLAKLYGPSMLMIGAGISCILGAHGIMKKRNAGLALALDGMTQAFERYRNRVTNELGENADQHFYFGTETVDKLVLDEAGTDIVENATVADTKMTELNPYRRLFTASNEYWRNDAGMNRMFLIGQQNFANEKLKCQGHLFLNDVLTACGFKPTSIGAQVGWIYDPENPNIDNYIDFRLNDGMYSGSIADGWNANEKDIWLDFNVDGPIINKIDQFSFIGDC